MDSTELRRIEKQKRQQREMADNFRWAPAKVVGMSEKLIELRRTKPVWEVIEAIMKMWSDTAPKEYDSYLVDLQFTKDDGKITNIGGKQFSNVSIDSEGAMLRHRLDIPVKVMYMIRRLYSTDELQMDEKFYNKWASMFPKTVVSEVK